jgi:hypothetical protein
VAVTLTPITQTEVEPITAPDRAIEPVPAFAVIVPPPHEPVTAGGVATTKPIGKVSVNETLLSGKLPLLLVIVNVRVVVPFN